MYLNRYHIYCLGTLVLCMVFKKNWGRWLYTDNILNPHYFMNKVYGVNIKTNLVECLFRSLVYFASWYKMYDLQMLVTMAISDGLWNLQALQRGEKSDGV